MRKAFIVLIIISCILFETDWLLCELIKGGDVNAWNILRNKFESSEMFLVLTGLIVALKDFKWFLSLAYFKKDVEKDVAIRAVVAYWQFSLGDFLDRVFFNVNELNWNDAFIYIYVIYYSYKTIRYATDRKVF